MKRIVFKLKLYRHASRLSQTKVADKLNLSHRSYQRIENEETNCDVCFLYRFCNLLNADFNFLTSPTPPVINEGTIFIKSFKELESQEDLKVVSYVFKILDVAEKLTKDLEEEIDFMHSDSFYYISTPSKKILNQKAMKQCQVINHDDSIECCFGRLDDHINYWDCLLYYRPRYSIKSNYISDIEGNKFQIKVYTRHFYELENITNFNLALMTPATTLTIS